MQRIKAVNHHLKAALDAVREGVMVVERAGRSGGIPAVLYGNRAMAEMAGVSVAQLSGMRLDRLVEDARGLLAGLGLAGGGKGGEVSALLLGEGGRTGRWCHWRGVPVTESDGRVLSYILTVTERSGGSMVRKYEGAPPQAGEWKQDVVDMVTDSARYVAHEFNNALTAILLPVEMVIGQLPAGSDLHGKLQVTYESAQRAADLAKDFLDCFRPREPERVRCRLEPLLRRALRMATCAQNVDWSFEAEGGLRDVLADAGQIERLVLNLVRNACQAMPGGGRLLVTAVNHEVTGPGQGLLPGPHVAISVRDWGPGIPQDYLPHLFNSRFTTKEDGNGCGLAICHQIARDHGGEIFVQSRPQVGTVFHVVLPALEAVALTGVAERTERTEGTEGTEGTTGVGRGLAEAKGLGGRAMPSLLVVDDEEGIRFSLGAIAARLGCPVEMVSSGEEAIQRYRERHRSGRAHDMVILDINLKGMGGEEVFRELRRLDRGVTVLATSGQYSDAELSRYEAMGFAGFLPKPFSVDEFREMLERFAAAV